MSQHFTRPTVNPICDGTAFMVNSIHLPLVKSQQVKKLNINKNIQQ